MPIENIMISNYKKYFGGNSDSFEKAKLHITKILTEELTYLDVSHLHVYNLLGERHQRNAGVPGQRIIIFVNATTYDAEGILELQKPETIGGVENNYIKFLSPSGNAVLITSEHGTPLAEWHENSWELNILFDVFNEVNDTSIAIFKYIIQEWNRLVWFPKTLESSWKYTKNKNKLASKITEQIKGRKERQLHEDERQIERWENQINEWRRQIKYASDNIIQRRLIIQAVRENIDSIQQDFIKDLDLIIKHNKVEDLNIKDNKFIVHTIPLYMYTEKGERFYAGRYKIEINMYNSDVHIFGDNPRQSYWTTKDPHPHVSGHDGTPCFGNVSSTVAELCSQMQIYALTMVCIDFLESVNTADIAGNNVYNWDKVDDEGNIINEDSSYQNDDEEENLSQCENCGEWVHPDTIRLAYNNIEHDEDGYYAADEICVCADCLENKFYYDEDVNEYVRY